MTRYDVDMLNFPGGSHPNVLCKFSTAAQHEYVKHYEVREASSDAPFDTITLIMWCGHLLPVQKRNG